MTFLSLLFKTIEAPTGDNGQLKTEIFCIRTLLFPIRRAMILAGAHSLGHEKQDAQSPLFHSISDYTGKIDLLSLERIFAFSFFFSPLMIVFSRMLPTHTYRYI